MQSQTNGIRNLIMSEYFNLSIVLLKLEKQIEIGREARCRRLEARRLSREADTCMIGCVQKNTSYRLPFRCSRLVFLKSLKIQWALIFFKFITLILHKEITFISKKTIKISTFDEFTIHY